MIAARDKLTGLIRSAVEDDAGLELATSPGKPTSRGGYDTTWMFAQDGTATFLSIEAAWYPGSASFDLAGPAVDRAEQAFWAGRGLRLSRRHVSGPLQCHLFVPYADGSRADLLLGVLPALLAPYRQDAGPARGFPRQLNLYKFDVIAVTTVNVRAESEDQARALINGLNSIATRTAAGDDIETADGLDVPAGGYGVVNVSPRGRGYLVSAATPGGEKISVSAPELIPEPALAGLSALREELAAADRALAGDSNDAEHDALHGLAEAARGLLPPSGRPGAGARGEAGAAALAGNPADGPHHVKDTGEQQPAPEAIRVQPSAETLAHQAELSARAAAPGTGQGQLQQPLPERSQGEIAATPARNDSASHGAAGGPGFPGNLANGVPARTAGPRQVTGQPGGPARGVTP